MENLWKTLVPSKHVHPNIVRIRAVLPAAELIQQQAVRLFQPRYLGLKVSDAAGSSIQRIVSGQRVSRLPQILLALLKPYLDGGVKVHRVLRNRGHVQHLGDAIAKRRLSELTFPTIRLTHDPGQRCFGDDLLGHSSSGQRQRNNPRTERLHGGRLHHAKVLCEQYLL